MSDPTFEILTYSHVAENSTKDDAARRETVRENATRPAVAEVTYTVTGTGQTRVKAMLDLPVKFREEPHVTVGSTVVLNPDYRTWHDPVGTGGVYAWKRDSKGLYVGAFLWVRVDVHPQDDTVTDDPPQTFQTTLCLTFSAIAVKDVPTGGTTTSADPHNVDYLSQVQAALGIGI